MFWFCQTCFVCQIFVVLLIIQAFFFYPALQLSKEVDPLLSVTESPSDRDEEHKMLSK